MRSFRADAPVYGEGWAGTCENAAFEAKMLILWQMRRCGAFGLTLGWAPPQFVPLRAETKGTFRGL